jgi:hypothetical protein
MTVSGNFVASAGGVPSSGDGTGSLYARPRHGTATAGKKRRKLFLLDLYGTAVGKKYCMASAVSP